MEATTPSSMPRRPACTAAVRGTVPGRQQNGNAVGHEHAAPCRRTNRPGIQDERVRRGHLIDLGSGHDGGVNLVHPGQVPPLLKSQQILESTTVTMNTLWVVSDMERQVPPVIGGPTPRVRRHRLHLPGHECRQRSGRKRDEPADRG